MAKFGQEFSLLDLATHRYVGEIIKQPNISALFRQMPAKFLEVRFYGLVLCLNFDFLSCEVRPI